jgi:DNA-binding NarL/FixJ family response regulator
MTTAQPQVIRVAILQADPLRSVGLHTILGSEADFEVREVSINTVLNGAPYDILLLGSDGHKLHSAMAAMRSVWPDVRVIATGMGNSEEDVLRALSAGAKGYVAEEATPAEMKEAIRTVHAGSVWAPGHALSTFIERVTLSPRSLAAPANDEVRISQRERQVLKLLVAGRSNREIGDALGIEERTVKAHVAQLLRKVGVQNRIALSVHAVTHALLTARQ